MRRACRDRVVDRRGQRHRAAHRQSRPEDLAEDLDRARPDERSLDAASRAAISRRACRDPRLRRNTVANHSDALDSVSSPLANGGGSGPWILSAISSHRPLVASRDATLLDRAFAMFVVSLVVVCSSVVLRRAPSAGVRFVLFIFLLASPTRSMPSSANASRIATSPDNFALIGIGLALLSALLYVLGVTGDPFAPPCSTGSSTSPSSSSVSGS